VTVLPALSTAFLPATLAQTTGAWLFQSIAGWWLAAVSTVLGDLVFQCLHPGCQCGYCLFKQSNDRFFALQICLVYFVAGW